MDKNNEFKKYVENLEKCAKAHPEKAKIEAEEALIETGVLNKDGSTKKEIITESVESLVNLQNREKISQNTEIILKQKEKEALIKRSAAYERKFSKKYIALFILWFAFAFSFVPIGIIDKFQHDWILFAILTVSFVLLIILASFFSNDYTKYIDELSDVKKLDKDIGKLELCFKIDNLSQEKKSILNNVLSDTELVEILKEHFREE